MGDLIVLELSCNVCENAIDFCRKFQLFKIAYGSGQCESLAMPMQKFMAHGRDPKEQKKDTDTHVIRCAIGLEDPKDLMDDLQQALEGIPLDKNKWGLSTQLIHPFNRHTEPEFFTSYVPIFPRIQYITLSIPAPTLDLLDSRQFLYTRARHVSNNDLEQRLAQVQKREACLTYASKIGAITVTFFSLLKKNDLVVIFKGTSRKTRLALAHFRDHFGIKLEIIENVEKGAEAIMEIIDGKGKNQIGKRKIHWIHLEPFLQPMLHAIDINKILTIAHDHTIRTSMDGSLTGLHQ